MDITARVIQSSSVVHGMHWGKFIDESMNLLVVKSTVLEFYLFNDLEKTFYLVLEQNFGFFIRLSAVVNTSPSHQIILNSTKYLFFLNFERDYFKITETIDVGNENIQKLEVFDNILVVSFGFNTISVYNYSTKEINYVFTDFCKIIDWNFIDDKILILENSGSDSEIIWKIIDFTTVNSKKVGTFFGYFFPIKFLHLKGKILLFGSDGSIFLTENKNLEQGNHRKMEGIFSSSMIHNDKLYFITDKGDLFSYGSDLKQEKFLPYEDSQIISLSSMIFLTTHNGKSAIFNENFELINESIRNGPIIDGDLYQVDHKSLIIATSSSILKLNHTKSVFYLAKILDIAKLTLFASISTNFLFLYPELKIIDTENYEIIKPESLNLKNLATLSVSKFQNFYVQVTENSIFYDNIEKVRLPCQGLTCYISDLSIVIGLVSQTVQFYQDFSLVFEHHSLDFSALYIFNQVIYVGLQQGLIKRFDSQGIEIDNIDTHGIPHSYTNHWGLLFVGTRDGTLSIFEDNILKISHKLGEKSVDLCKFNEKVIANTDKCLIIENSELIFSVLDLPPSKMIVSANCMISVSKDILFFDIDQEIQNLKQTELRRTQGIINRLIKVSENEIFYSQKLDGLYCITLLNLLTNEEKSTTTSIKVNCVVYSSHLACFIVGGLMKKITESEKKIGCIEIYSESLEKIVVHTFNHEVTSFCTNENHLFVASTYTLYDLLLEDLKVPVKIASYSGASRINDLLFEGGMLFIATEGDGLIKVSAESNMQTIFSTEYRNRIKKLALIRDKIVGIDLEGFFYVYGSDQTKKKIFIGNGGRCIIKGSIYNKCLKQDANIYDKYACVCGMNGEIIEIKISDMLLEALGLTEIFQELNYENIAGIKQENYFRLNLVRYYEKLSQEKKDSLQNKYGDIAVLINSIE